MSKKRNICYIAGEEPEFIKKFKAKVGYKEEEKVGIEAKFSENEEPLDKSSLMTKAQERLMQADSDDEEFRPQVVVMKDGDISADEFYKDKQVKKVSKLDEDDDLAADGGKIIFRKPTKKTDAKNLLNSASSTKKAKDDVSDEKNEKSEKQSKTKLNKPNLLSFNWDEEDE